MTNVSNTITIGGQPVARSVAGALGRLELAVAADADSRADVDFLRERINAVEAQRDELAEALRQFAKFSCSPAGECYCNNCRAAAVLAKHGVR